MDIVPGACRLSTAYVSMKRLFVFISLYVNVGGPVALAPVCTVALHSSLDLQAEVAVGLPVV